MNVLNIWTGMGLQMSIQTVKSLILWECFCLWYLGQVTSYYLPGCQQRWIDVGLALLFLPSQTFFLQFQTSQVRSDLDQLNLFSNTLSDQYTASCIQIIFMTRHSASEICIVISSVPTFVNYKHMRLKTTFVNLKTDVKHHKIITKSYPCQFSGL